MSPIEGALLIALGALAFLDQWPAVQTMASRPLVVGVLAGWVLGSPGEGAFWGAVFESVYLGVLPVGAARYPDSGLAALVGTVVVIAAPGGEIVPAGYAAAAAGLAGLVGERAGRAQRRWNAHTADAVRVRVLAGDPAAPGRGVAAALLRGVGLGAAVAALALVVALAGLDRVSGSVWSGPLPVPDVRLAAAAAAAAAGLRLFGRARPDFGIVATGALGGALIAWAAAA